MRDSLLDLICCPVCQAPLRMEATRWHEGEMWGGHRYPLQDGMPRLYRADGSEAVKSAEARGWAPYHQQPGIYSGVSNDTMWGVDTAHMDMAASVGAWAWNFQNVTGASRLNATSGIGSARAKSGVVVNDRLSATVTRNAIRWVYVNTGNICQSGAVIARVIAGFASGNIQTPHSDLDIGAGCVAHG